MDNRSFEPVSQSFEDTWPHYSYAMLTRLVLRVAAWLDTRGPKLPSRRADLDSSLSIRRQLSP